MSSRLSIFKIIVCIFFVFPLNVSGQTLFLSGPVDELQYADRTDIEEVVFEDGCGVTEIPDYAFLGCTSLKRIKLPEGLKKIGFQAFSECSGLETVIVPESLEDIGSNAFAYCARLKDMRFPDGLRHIGHNAFSFCESLEEVVLPDSIEEIESYAFSDCSALRKVRLPANDRMLGELLMNCCGSLVEIIAPSPVAPKIDCESYVFDPEDNDAYSRCVLKVPDNSIDSYNVSNSWNIFNNIVTGGW